jgi:two-component system, NarL family, nitrate/nitrite response regulator NarL
VVSVVRVHLADDHALFREGLSSLLAAREGVEVVGTSTTGEEAAERIALTKPDVIVTQLDMDLKTSEEILSSIRRASPDSRILVLTVFDSLHFLKALSKMGIDAYVHKSSFPEELVDTIDALSRQAGGHNAVISMPRGMLERLDGEPAGGLSERETQILVLVARGLSNDHIAEQLHLAPSTVKRHLANVYEKIGVGSRSEAIRTALQEQWIGLREITQEAPSTDGHRDGSGARRGTER